MFPHKCKIDKTILKTLLHLGFDWKHTNYPIKDTFDVEDSINSMQFELSGIVFDRQFIDSHTGPEGMYDKIVCHELTQTELLNIAYDLQNDKLVELSKKYPSSDNLDEIRAILNRAGPYAVTLMQHLDSLVLREAAGRGYLETVKLCLDYKADIHSMNNEALCHASHGGHDTVVKYLLDNGADIHANNEQPLRYALFEPQRTFSTAKLLVSRGSDIDLVIEFAERKLQNNQKGEERTAILLKNCQELKASLAQNEINQFNKSHTKKCQTNPAFTQG